VTKRARDHHELPELYLRGFCQEQAGERRSFLWVYKRAKPFHPGVHKERDNPHRSGVHETTRIRDRYAITLPNGERDFDSYEHRLQQEETKVNVILTKLRSRQTISPEEKEKFASYLQLTLLRTSRRLQSALPEYRKAVDSIPFQRIATSLADRGEFGKAREWLNAERYLRSPDGGEAKLLNESMVAGHNAVLSAFLAKDWLLYVAPSTAYFVTSDSPLSFDWTSGLSRFPFWFPISREIALVASPKGAGDLEYVTASADEIFVINWLTICQAEAVYSPKSEQWVWDILDHGVSLTDEQERAFLKVFPQNRMPSRVTDEG